jgi:glycosyltransferase involved in cell wall biosynthesis
LGSLHTGEEMNQTPLVSIIVPCYNSGKTLSRTIDSVIRQTWKNIEIIIINDGSTDRDTIELIGFLATKPKITVYSQSNKGLASARNIGIKISKGEFILPLDSDDWLDDNAIKSMLETYNQDELNSIVFPDIKLEGERVGIKQTYCNPFEQLFSNQLPYCMLFPKNVFNEISGYDKSLLLGLEDWDLNLRLLISGHKFKKNDNPLFHYTTAPSGMFVDITSKKFGIIFKRIRDKNIYNYKFRNLYKTYRLSKKISSKRHLSFYFVVHFIHKMTPPIIINKMYLFTYKLHNKFSLLSNYLNLIIKKFKIV